MVPPPSSHPVHGIRQESCSLNENPSNFINRELSWIEFNRHVLTEAMDKSHPLLERVKFLSIFANNLDEFFMIRVSGLQRQVAKGVREAPPDGMTPSKQLDAIHSVLSEMLQQQSDVWHNDLVPALSENGIQIVPVNKLDDFCRESLRAYFIREIFPVLTPLAFDKTHPFPFISNLSLNLAILLHDPTTMEEYFARVKVPTTLFPRIIKVPEKPGYTGPEKMVFIEECVASNLDILFPGLAVSAVYPFRVTRDADLEIEEDEASDLLTAIEEGMEMRRIGSPVRIEVDRSMPARICSMIGRKLGIAPDMFYRVSSPLGMVDLMEFLRLDRPDLKDEPFTPSMPPALEPGGDYFSAIRKGDILLFHPYDSFTPVIHFLSQEGKKAVVVGRSIEVGRPMAALLLNADATVTICHSRTKNLAAETSSADILVSAAGKARFITADMVKDNAVVIDVGTNYIDGKLCGDVDFENVRDKAAAITPVPGGVGPMTIATLMENTYLAAKFSLCSIVL